MNHLSTVLFLNQVHLGMHITPVLINVKEPVTKNVKEPVTKKVDLGPL